MYVYSTCTHTHTLSASLDMRMGKLLSISDDRSPSDTLTSIMSTFMYMYTYCIYTHQGTTHTYTCTTHVGVLLWCSIHTLWYVICCTCDDEQNVLLPLWTAPQPHWMTGRESLSCACFMMWSCDYHVIFTLKTLSWSDFFISCATPLSVCGCGCVSWEVSVTSTRCSPSSLCW